MYSFIKMKASEFCVLLYSCFFEIFSLRYVRQTTLNAELDIRQLAGRVSDFFTRCVRMRIRIRIRKAEIIETVIHYLRTGAKLKRTESWQYLFRVF